MTLLGYTIISSIQGMFYMPFYGISSAMSILVGQNAGAHQFYKLTPLLSRTIVICLIYFSFLAPIFIMAYPWLIKIFISKDQIDQMVEVMAITKPIFLILSLIMFAQSLQGILVQFLKSLGDTKFIFWAYSITLVLAWMLPTFFILKVSQTLLAIMIPVMIFHGIIFVICLQRYCSEKWKKTLVAGKVEISG